MNILESLLVNTKTAEVDPDLLETLGSQASAKYLNEGVPLNQAIKKIAEEYPHFGNEHVKRIAEFANNSTFQQLFSKEEDKNIHFDIADPGTILRDLKDGGSPEHDGRTLKDTSSDSYLQPPTSKDEELSKEVDDTDKDIEKVAGFTDDLQAGHADPVLDVYDTHKQLESAREELLGLHGSAAIARNEAADRFYKTAKQEVLNPDGLGFAGVMRAVQETAPTNEVAFSALRPVAEKLAHEGLVTEKDMEKTASITFKVPNPEHPLIQSFEDLVKVSVDVAKYKQALQEVGEGLNETSSFLKSVMK